MAIGHALYSLTGNSNRSMFPKPALTGIPKSKSTQKSRSWKNACSSSSTKTGLRKSCGRDIGVNLSDVQRRRQGMRIMSVLEGKAEKRVEARTLEVRYKHCEDQTPGQTKNGDKEI
mmetsp:Transcript_18758/g.34856  ORF Transcript_18758/g.34856 Transcript_18758/m.34856 type:complete len:116 (+) Transcript_18758:161-508(+)